MQTRRQDPKNHKFRQDAFASSPEYERGVLANLVAARCQHLDDPEDIALVWWLQQISWRPGGLEKFAQDFVDSNKNRFTTCELNATGAKLGQFLDAETVREVRSSIPGGVFPLRGERYRPRSAYDFDLSDLLDSSDSPPPPDYSEEESAGFPLRYAFEELQRGCIPDVRVVAEGFKRLLVDPKSHLDDLAGAICVVLADRTQVGCKQALKELLAEEENAAVRSIVSTEVAKQIFEELDFAFESESFVLIEGREGIGKTEAAQAWVAAHPGRAVYIRLEPGNDETTFFRGIARRIGTACAYTRKATDMRVRIEDALQPGQLMLAIDEAHYLWPQANRSYRSPPARVEWIRTLVDLGVTVALISTPQYFARQCQRFDQAGWNVKQVQRRLARTFTLPLDPIMEDVISIARLHFPEASKATLHEIGAAACSTHGCLGAIEGLRKRFDFFRSRDSSASESEILSRVLGEILPNAEMLQEAGSTSARGLNRPGIRIAADPRRTRNGGSKPTNHRAVLGKER